MTCRSTSRHTAVTYALNSNKSYNYMWSVYLVFSVSRLYYSEFVMWPITFIESVTFQQHEHTHKYCIVCDLRTYVNFITGTSSYAQKSDEQKLIYSGKLLRDSAVLKDVLRQYDGQDTHTVHLVFTPKNQRFEPSNGSGGSSSSSMPTAGSTSAAAAAQSSANELR